jgi:signal transduction histidine kinase
VGEVVRVRAQHAAAGVSFEVSDHGPGIAREHREMIFEGYRQVEGVAVGGTGLGLAISRRLVELHGGTLTLVSEVGQGSTFTAFFPARGLAQAPGGQS